MFLNDPIVTLFGPDDAGPEWPQVKADVAVDMLHIRRSVVRDWRHCGLSRTREDKRGHCGSRGATRDLKHGLALS
jgi:hypothetical protein